MVIIKNSVPVKIGNNTKPHFISFEGLADSKEHIAIVFDDKNPRDETYVRIHSECLTGDVFHSQRCDCGPQLDEAIELFSEIGGVILYLRQEGRGIGLYEKLAAYELQIQEGMDTYAANECLNHKADARNYTVAAQMLKALNKQSVILLSNNPEKRKQIEELGINVVDMRPTGVFQTEDNELYLQAKRDKAGHKFKTTKTG